MMIKGRCPVARSCSRNRPAASNPLMTGMSTSISTTSGGLAIRTGPSNDTWRSRRFPRGGRRQPRRSMDLAHERTWVRPVAAQTLKDRQSAATRKAIPRRGSGSRRARSPSRAGRARRRAHAAPRARRQPHRSFRRRERRAFPPRRQGKGGIVEIPFRRRASKGTADTIQARCLTIVALLAAGRLRLAPGSPVLALEPVTLSKTPRKNADRGSSRITFRASEL